VDQSDNPTPPAESASGTPTEEQGVKPRKEKGDGEKPSVGQLLAAARGDVASREARPVKERTAVPPAARLASTGTVADAAPTGDAPGKEVPAATPAAARAVPASGASKRPRLRRRP